MKRIILLLALVAMSLPAWCQFLSIGKLGQDILVEDAVSEGVFLIRSEYHVRENSTGKLYGRGGRSNYGVIYTVGYKLADCYIVNEAAVSPWSVDSDYDRYREDKRYTPMLTDSFYVKKMNSDNEFTALSTCAIHKIGDTGLYGIEKPESDKDGFETSELQGEIKGWIIWNMIPTDVALEDTTMDWSVSQKTLDIKKDDTSIKIDTPVRQQKLLGGLYVVPEVTGIGQIKFRLRGLVTPSDNGWEICLCDKNWIDDSAEQSEDNGKDAEEEQVTETDNVDDELTDIPDNSTKKKKKSKD